MTGLERRVPEIYERPDARRTYGKLFDLDLQTQQRGLGPHKAKGS